MKQSIKRVISTFLCAILALGVFGCVKSSGGSNAVISEPGAKGRYIEQEIKLPLPEGSTEQYLIGIGRSENGIEVFANIYSGTEDQTIVRYFRHSIDQAGTVTTTEEQWLNELASDGGNEMRVQQADDGTLYMIYTGFDESYNLVPHLILSRDDGKTGESLTGDGIALLEQANSLGILADGKIAASEYFNGNLYLLDANGNLQQNLEGETKKVAPVVAAQGTKVAYIAKGAKSVVVMDTASGSSEEYPYDFAEQSSPILAFAPDGSLYLCDATGIYRHVNGGTLWERVVDGSTTSIGLPSFYASSLMIANDGSNDIYVIGGNQLLKYSLDTNASAVATKTLTVFSLHEEGIVQQAVVAFNRMQSEVSVEYTVAMNQSTGGTEQDYIKALNTELLAGKGPDIIILDGLPMSSYIEKGVLSDISTIVDSAEGVLPNVRQSFASADGKLYAMPTRIMLPFAVASKETIDAFGSLSALADRCEQSGDTPYLANAAFSYQTLAEVLLGYYSKSVETGNEQDITSFLTNAGRIANAIGSNDQLCEGWDAVNGMSQAELLDGMRVSNYGPQIWAYMTGRAQGMLLLPISSIYNGMIALSAAEQTNAVMTDIAGQYEPSGIVGINRASALQDAAAEFVKVLLSKEVQNGDRFANSFPVNSQALTEVMANVDNSISQSMHLDATNSLDSEWPTEATRNALLALLQSVDQPLSTDHTLNDMLTPAVVAYLDGSDTLESAAGKMKSVIDTYLSE